MHCHDLTNRDVTIDETIRAFENHCALLVAEHDRMAKLIEHMRACKSENFPTGSVVRPHPPNQQVLGAADDTGAFGEQEKAAA